LGRHGRRRDLPKVRRSRSSCPGPAKNGGKSLFFPSEEGRALTGALASGEEISFPQPELSGKNRAAALCGGWRRAQVQLLEEYRSLSLRL